jgi:hypothetical protein
VFLKTQNDLIEKRCIRHFLGLDPAPGILLNPIFAIPVISGSSMRRTMASTFVAKNIVDFS